MSVVSKCPKCHEQVTIPDGLDPEAEVRCPLCAVVYPLDEALAEAPPALIPVDTGATEVPRPDSDAPAESDLISQRFPGGESADGAGPSQMETGPTDDASPAIDTGQTAVDTDALAALNVYQSDTLPSVEHENALPNEREGGDGGFPARRRGKKKEKGAIRFITEVFGGGILGLLIGYYVLCWVLGPQHDLPKLPLPLLPHTMHWFGGDKKPEKGRVQPPPRGDGGITHLERGDFDQAIADYDQTVRLNPTDYPPYVNRREIYRKKGQKPKAEADFARARQLGYVPE